MFTCDRLGDRYLYEIECLYKLCKLKLSNIVRGKSSFYYIKINKIDKIWWKLTQNLESRYQTILISGRPWEKNLETEANNSHKLIFQLSYYFWGIWLLKAVDDFIIIIENIIELLRMKNWLGRMVWKSVILIDCTQRRPFIPLYAKSTMFLL